MTKNELMKNISAITAARVFSDRVACVCRAAELLANEVGELVALANNAGIKVACEIEDLPSDLHNLREDLNRLSNEANANAANIRRLILDSEKANAEALIASLSPAAIIQLIKEKA